MVLWTNAHSEHNDANSTIRGWGDDTVAALQMWPSSGVGVEGCIGLDTGHQGVVSLQGCSHSGEDNPHDLAKRGLELIRIKWCALCTGMAAPGRRLTLDEWRQRAKLAHC